MKSFTETIKKSPTLYRAAKKAKYQVKHLKNIMKGTEGREYEWSSRHLRQGKDLLGPASGEEDWISSYWRSKDHPHRVLLMETIAKFNPESILEIGSNCGPNIRLLAKKYPMARIVGIDVNPEAVRVGNELLKEEGITNAELTCAKADDLSMFDDKSYDVVFTDAVLIYIGPDKIMKVIKEFMRVAKKGLVFVEWHSFDKMDSGMGEYYNHNWKRNYFALLSKFISEDRVHIRKITREEWLDDRWSDVGAIIDCTLMGQGNKLKV